MSLTPTLEDPLPAFRFLVSLDPTVTLPSGASVQLATNEWVSGVTSPNGHRLLELFELVDGLPRWRWRIGDVVLEREYLERAQAWFDERGACVGVSGNIVNDLPMSRVSTAYRTVFSLGKADGRLKPSGDGIYLYSPAAPTKVVSAMRTSDGTPARPASRSNLATASLAATSFSPRSSSSTSCGRLPIMRLAGTGS